MLAKFSGVESDRIVSKFRKRKRDVTLLLYWIFVSFYFLASLCREVRPLNEIWLLYCHWCTIIILTEISKQQSCEKNMYWAEIFFLKYAKWPMDNTVDHLTSTIGRNLSWNECTSAFFWYLVWCLHHWGKDTNYVFTCLNTLIDNLIRQRIDGEIEQLKSSVHQILSDQQQEFAQAFGLQDDHSSSEVFNTDRPFIINK